MNITVAIPSLDTAVKRQLSVIGKRATVHDASPSEQKPSFYDITPSSAEDGTLHDFYTDAIVLLNTTSQYFITASTAPTPADPSTGSSASASGVVTLSFPTNHNYAMNTTITVAFTSFLVAYAVYAWLSIVNPALVKRYEEAMREKLQSLIQLIFHKNPPQQGYSYNLPPVINTPNDRITINAGEQMLIAYTLGSDGIDDLQITSTVPASVVVSKNATSRLFSIYAVPTLEDTTMAVVTISRSTTSTTLATIRVTALPVPEIVPADLPPVLLGYNPTSDSVNIVNGQTLSISYVGTITDAVTSDDDVAVVTVTPSLSDPTTGTISILTNGVGNATITFYNDNGWSYILYTGVSAVQGTSPVINVVSPVSAVAGDTIVIPYTLGSDGYDDLVATIIGQSPEGTVTISKTGGATSGTFTITGVQAGVATITITSTRHPESNKSFSAIITQSQTSEPVIYGYAPGATINVTEGGDEIEIDYYPGSEGSMIVTASVTSGIPSDYIDLVQLTDSVLVTPLAAGNVTLTFTNSTMSFQQTISLTIAARPAVVTQPVIYWPEGLTLNENNGFSTIRYALGNDNVDDLVFSVASEINTWGEANHVVTLGAKDTTNHTITITAGAAGAAVIRAARQRAGESAPYLILGEYEVNVLWVEPAITYPPYRDGDEVHLEVGETYAPLLTFTEASHGSTALECSPAGVITSATIANTLTAGSKVVNVVAGGSDGVAYLKLYNDSWSVRLTLLVGNVTPPGVEPSIHGSTNRNINAGSSDTIEIDNGSAVSASVSPSSVYLNVSVSNGNVNITAIPSGTVGTRYATVYIYTNAGTTLSVSYTIIESVSVLPEWNSSMGDGTYIVRGTFEGAQNPVFILDVDGRVELLTMTTSDSQTYVLIYDEQTQICSTYLAGSSTTAILSAIVDILTDSYYNVNVTSSSMVEEDPSEVSGMVEAYFVDHGGGGGIPAYTPGQTGIGIYKYGNYNIGFKVYDNNTFEILTNGSGLLYYWTYNEGTGTWSNNECFAGSSGGEQGQGRWPWVASDIEYLTGQTRRNPAYTTSVTPAGTPAFYVESSS